ncbi:MAG: hypothetical protein U1E73_11685 [Planctomycetota bacterium]
MRTAFPVASIVLLASTALAQSLSLSNNAACNAQVTVGAGSQTNTLPAGPMPAQGSLDAAMLPFAGARLDWRTAAWAAGMSATIDLSTSCSGSGFTVSAALPAVDLVLQLANPTARPVVVELGQVTSATAGTATPLLRVDVGDDGSDELTQQMQGAVVVAQVAPTPLRIRVRAAMQVTGTAGAATSLVISCRPADGQVVPIAFGCSGSYYEAVPTFSGDVQVMVGTTFIDPAVAVFGFGVSPLLLPSQPFQVCLLMPRPDVLLMLMPWQPVTLPIPPAARPFVFYTQTVGLGSELLMTSTAYQVSMN